MFEVHFTGDWIRNLKTKTTTKTKGWVREFKTLDDIRDPIDREQFEWMIMNGTNFLSAGNFEWQIKTVNV